MALAKKAGSVASAATCRRRRRDARLARREHRAEHAPEAEAYVADASGVDAVRGGQDVDARGEVADAPFDEGRLADQPPPHQRIARRRRGALAVLGEIEREHGPPVLRPAPRGRLDVGVLLAGVGPVLEHDGGRGSPRVRRLPQDRRHLRPARAREADAAHPHAAVDRRDLGRHGRALLQSGSTCATRAR